MIDASVVVVGAGRVGAPAALYLACAGVRQIGVVDGGRVGPEHVATAPLHYAPDVGTLKAESAAQKLGVLNPQITVEPYPVVLERANAGAIVMGQSLVVECTGSPEVRELISEACSAQGVPLVVASDAALGAVLGGEPPIDTPAADGIVGAAAALQAIRLLREAVNAPPSQSS